ncbi:LUD domain-containing protein [Nocardioidaceae bacterium]|nr:LUD domain-containing protein [Nocardioidaceae bacterium]
MSAREDILAAVRAATASAPEVAPVDRGYRRTQDLDPQAVLDLFVERVADYRAEVVTCRADEVAATVRAQLTDADGAVVLPPGLDLDLGGTATVVDRPEQRVSAADLDAAYAVVTAARVGIAETGTIVLDHAADQGRRAITLVPDRHVCVVRADQVVESVPEAVATLDPTRPQTWISGPSATSDIELDRVEGVHGPRTLVVVLVR